MKVSTLAPISSDAYNGRMNNLPNPIDYTTFIRLEKEGKAELGVIPSRANSFLTSELAWTFPETKPWALAITCFNVLFLAVLIGSIVLFVKGHWLYGFVGLISAICIEKGKSKAACDQIAKMCRKDARIYSYMAEGEYIRIRTTSK